MGEMRLNRVERGTNDPWPYRGSGDRHERSLDSIRAVDRRDSSRVICRVRFEYPSYLSFQSLIGIDKLFLKSSLKLAVQSRMSSARDINDGGRALKLRQFTRVYDIRRWKRKYERCTGLFRVIWWTRKKRSHEWWTQSRKPMNNSSSLDSW